MQRLSSFSTFAVANFADRAQRAGRTATWNAAGVCWAIGICGRLGARGFALLILLAVVALCPPTAFGESFGADGLEFFEKKIRPLLAAKCFECHSQRAEKLKGGLLLDSRKGFLEGGDSGPAAIPGKPAGSLFIEAVGYQNADLQMPPRSKLSDREISDLEQWVSIGMPWPKQATPENERKEPVFDIAERRRSHWAWQPVKKAIPPKVARAGWPANPVDAFVLHRLEAKGLEPAPRASKRSLIRRLSYALTGLPPSPEAIRDFQADNRPQAYERLVDGLLASPQFGERWARHWLDLVRYAETLGHEFDYEIPNAWRYRDYLIRAFNQDVPYNLFAKEHIAGDLLEEARRNPENGDNESWMGTGFYWLGQQVHSPVDVQMNQLDLIDNQIDVLSKTFLGLTVSCARCHDHKFDAISTKDFYSLYGVLRSSRYHEAAVDAPETWDRFRNRLKAKKTAAREAASLAWMKNGALLAEYVNAGLRLLADSRADQPSSASVAGSSAQSHESENIPPDTKALPPDILFEDFETSPEKRWEVDGDAFAGNPFSSGNPSNGASFGKSLGQRFASSNSAGTEKGKQNRGRLLSTPFLIQRDYIHFLIAGGSDRRRTAVHLWVMDGKAARTATGNRDNRFRPAQWDVREFRGRQARIELKDDASDEWGYVAADHFVFSERKRVFGFQNRPLPSWERIVVEAATGKLHPVLLKRWMEALDESRSVGSRHPLFALTRPANSDPSKKEAIFSGSKQRQKKKLSDSPSKAVEARNAVMADADLEGWSGWFFDGPALVDAQTNAGELLLSGAHATVSMESQPSIHSARYSKRFQGSLRSPTFAVRERYLHVLASGENSRINVVIDNFNLIRNPIYGGLKKHLSHSEKRWITFDLNRWRGRDAYVELKDTSAGDLAGGRADYGADGWFAVYQVIASPKPPPPLPPPVPENYLQRLAGASAELADFLAACEQKTLALLQQWNSGEKQKEGKSPQTSGRLSPEDLEWLNWLAQKELLLAPGEEEPFHQARSEYVALAGQVRPPTLSPAMVEGSGKDVAVFVRGNPRMPGEIAPRRFLEAFGSSRPINKASSGRREWAERIANPQNPLTARVYVNRIWHHLFGRGIVPTPDNFGVLGEEPTHPDLLNWLAHWFVTEGEWSSKRLIRLLATSSTYQMASKPNAGADEQDPTNRWFHKMPVRRLEGEAIRDAVLLVSGDLDLRQFGRPVPAHLTPFMTGRGRPGRNGPLDGERRRTIYQEVRRNFLSPAMLAFDAPIPHTTFGKRSVSNVPAQALILMNDPLGIHQAASWAEKLLSQTTAPKERIARAYFAALGREPTPEENRLALEFIEKQSQIYDEEKENGRRQAWSDFCHILFNAKEFIFLD